MKQSTTQYQSINAHSGPENVCVPAQVHTNPYAQPFRTQTRYLQQHYYCFNMLYTCTY